VDVTRNCKGCSAVRGSPSPARSTLFVTLISTARLLAFAVAAASCAVAMAQQKEYPDIPEQGTCRPFGGPWGPPYDYRHPPDRTVTSAVLPQIEALHFMPEIEFLQGDLTESNAAGQIEFVLLIYPNHHRALASLSRLAQRMRTDSRRIRYFTINCLFIRSVTYFPDDPVVRSIYGVHLSNFGRKKEALTQLLAAERLGANDANTFYNLGLLYLDMRDFDKSMSYAKRAYDAGFPLQGLRTRLQAAGKWRE